MRLPNLRLISLPLATLAVVGLAMTLSSPASAAESEMVGLLAVAIEPEVASELGLSPEQVEKLQDLADDREMAGLSQAMKMTGLARDERVERFAPFRAESERLAFEVLSERQRRRLEAYRAERDDSALRAVEAAAAETVAAAVTETPVATAAEPSTEPAAPSEAAPDEETVPTPETKRPGAERVVETPVVAEADDGKLSFNFRKQPWSDVLDWFADRAGLSLIVDTAPPGTLNYRDDRRYSATEALDVLNGVLLTKGYTLVRKDRMLLVINLEDDVVPPNVVTDVPFEELDGRGEYELIRVLLPLDRVDPDSAAEALQRLIGPQGAIVVLPEARLLQVTETAGRIRTMSRVVRAMEANASPDDALAEEAELRTYPTTGADPDSTLSVLQTLLAGSETARLAVDEQTGRLIALATPSEHRAIDATLGKLQQDGRRVERIPVLRIDPLAAAAMVGRLFNTGAAGGDAKPDPSAPIVEADREGSALLVRGNAGQVDQIRSLVEQIDASPTGSSGEALSGGTVRTLPLAGPTARMTLEQVERLWPALRPNTLRVATPGGAIPSYRPGATVEQEEYWREGPYLPEPSDEPVEGDDPADRDTTAGKATRAVFRFASETSEPASTDDASAGAASTDEASPILISPGPGGTVIASRDTEALDVLEQLIATVAGQSGAGGRQYAVFYLKFADAATAAALLEGVFGGDSGGGGGLMGDLVGGAIGGAGGDLVGDLLGMGGGSSTGGFTSVAVDIVPDLRLNALLVNASPKDLETVNQLLRVIDQPQGPDRIEAAGRPRAIRVYNADVTDVANVVRQVFQDRLQSSGGSGGQPSPEDLLRMLRDGGDGGKQQEQDKMTLGIDERSSSLIVRSSRPLFDEVQALVDILDAEGVEDPVATRVVSLRNTSSDALRQTLGSLLGDKAQIGTGAGATGASATPNNTARQRGNNNNNAERQARDTMRQIERFRRMQQMIQGGGRGRGERGGGGGGRPGGGGGRGGPGR